MENNGLMFSNNDSGNIYEINIDDDLQVVNVRKHKGPSNNSNDGASMPGVKAPGPFVEIEKSVDKSFAQVGDELIYTIKVKNDSEVIAENYLVTDTIRDLNKVEYIENSIMINDVAQTDALDDDIGSFINGDTIKALFPTIDANEEIVITFKVKILPDAAGTTILNSAILTNPNEPDDPIETPDVSTKVPENLKPEFSLVQGSKSVKDANGDGIAQPGEQLTYTITATNSGDKDALQVLIKDELINLLPHIKETDLDKVLLSVVGGSNPSADLTMLSSLVTGFKIDIKAEEQVVIKFTITMKDKIDYGAIKDTNKAGIKIIVNTAIVGPDEPTANIKVLKPKSTTDTKVDKTKPTPTIPNAGADMMPIFVVLGLAVSLTTILVIKKSRLK